MYRFRRRGGRQILELSLMSETTVKESIVKAKNLGFLPECDMETVSVWHESHIVNLSERLSDICANSSDNLFTIDIEKCEGGDYVQILCDMAFPVLMPLSHCPKVGVI